MVEDSAGVSAGTDVDPVDLERLRSVSSSSGMLADLELAESVVAAVLDAPTVWWCAGHPEDMCEADSPHDPPLPCRLVVLVPVKGGQDAS